MKYKWLLIISLISLLLVGSGKNTVETDITVVSHCGTIGSDTWAGAGTVHTILKNCGTNGVVVDTNSTLVIQAGAIVKFEIGTSLWVTGANSALQVNGENGTPVTFTSIRDDTVGGDTNNDESSTTPAPGNWSRIEFGDNSDDVNSLIDHAVIRYGGGNGNYVSYGSIQLFSASPTIQNSTIRDSLNYAYRADLNSFPELINNTLLNNGINGLALTSDVYGPNINTNATWDLVGTTYYVRDDIAIGVDKTLTINPGVIVKFNLGRALFVTGSNSALRALGTSGDPVTFTSIRDDTVGGDTNNDGSSSSPAPGNWSRIEFGDNSDDANSLIDHAVIRYSGGNGNYVSYGSIQLFSASPTIQNSTIRDSLNYAYRADLNSFPELVNNTLLNNGINGLALTNDVYGPNINTNATWDLVGTTYYVRDDIAIGVDKTLTINPGVIVKFNLGRALFVTGSNSALRALGTSGNPVTFTSIRDDTVGGDTNNDGSSSSPAPGNWSRIEFGDSSDDANSLINHAVIRYSGGNGNYVSYGAIQLLSASPTIQNSTIRDSLNYGIFTNNSTPNLASCNNIYSNNAYGLYNATPEVTVTAENQWWGSSSGPYHSTLNPGGGGNSVSDGVDFKPWALLPCGPPPPPHKFRSQAKYDGWVLESGEFSGKGGTKNNLGKVLQVGDNAKDKQYRVILSFGTAGIPDNAVITKVILKVKNAGIVGTNPMTTHNGLVIDIKMGKFYTLPALQIQDFQAKANKLKVGKFANKLYSGWYKAALYKGAYSFINKKGFTQLRLRFLLDDDNDSVADILKLYSGNALKANRPQLIIWYYVP